MLECRIARFMQYFKESHLYSTLGISSLKFWFLKIPLPTSPPSTNPEQCTTKSICFIRFNNLSIYLHSCTISENLISFLLNIYAPIILFASLDSTFFFCFYKYKICCMICLIFISFLLEEYLEKYECIVLLFLWLE